ncbi:hypothetical protein CONPUDRAFT_85157 [Coniophora puteana RWD-64-598 SS2]|uniref:DUF6533 domain-containing protein n=1 Tax=Coniophora puteana (strain RWD-64-598) TaxID=741705 RepID=A0A5M3MAW1_CONPW|nr:uncharacterized protein CONPUDRAFT_85157 [Coniophora puteana RWD-64-598 SS2]EIW75930.1 hypothetical protein CONPUDRAFT_85157 [Coniophora puteana RWD-64-598 SS2]
MIIVSDSTYLTLSMNQRELRSSVLNLGLEVELIWMRKFTAMSLVYGALRYGSMLWAVSQSIVIYTSPSIVTRNILTDICTIVELVIVLLLQGMMALRVYVLLEKSKRVLTILVVGFLASQAVTFSTIISLLARGGTIMPPAKVAISGIASCHTEPSEPQWVYPLSCSALLVFELLLIILCLYHAFVHLSWPMTTSIGHYAGSIVLLMYQQSLIYFIVALVSILLNAVSQAPALRSVRLSCSLRSRIYLI